MECFRRSGTPDALWVLLVPSEGAVGLGGGLGLMRVGRWCWRPCWGKWAAFIDKAHVGIVSAATFCARGCCSGVCSVW